MIEKISHQKIIVSMEPYDKYEIYKTGENDKTYKLYEP
eukprot:UN16890